MDGMFTFNFVKSWWNKDVFGWEDVNSRKQGTIILYFTTITSFLARNRFYSVYVCDRHPLCQVMEWLCNFPVEKQQENILLVFSCRTLCFYRFFASSKESSGEPSKEFLIELTILLDVRFQRLEASLLLEVIVYTVHSEHLVKVARHRSIILILHSIEETTKHFAWKNISKNIRKRSIFISLILQI